MAGSLLPEEVSPVERRVQIASKHVNWAYRTDLPPQDEAARAYAAATAEIELLKRNGAAEADIRRKANEHRLVREQFGLTRTVARREEGEIQLLAIGDSAWVGVPGELFCQIGLDIKEQSPFAHTYVVGYANCYQGYFPTPIAYDGRRLRGEHGPLESLHRRRRRERAGDCT